MIPKDIISKEWVHFITRPHTFFETTIWFHAYYSKYMKEVFEALFTENLFVEEHKNVVKRYVLKNEWEIANNTASRLSNIEIEKCEEILGHGFELNEKAEEFLSGEIKGSIKEVIDFLNELMVYSTFFPFLVLRNIKANDKNGQVMEMSNKLRSVSYYPKIFMDVLSPMAKNAGDTDLLMEKELLSNDFSKIPERMKLREEGMLFVNYNDNGKESIYWVKNTAEITNKIDGVSFDDVDEVNGMVGYKGKVRGKAKVIFEITDETKFEEGEILVTLTGNPSLNPIMKKAGAIVTDEGGISCHAAIISREFKTPCVIGTKIATKVFKDGDIVEVDADKGVVKRLK